MTTTATIKHEGGNDHDVMVTSINPESGDILAEHRLSEGESTMITLHSGCELVVTEVEKLKIVPADEPPSAPEAA